MQRQIQGAAETCTSKGKSVEFVKVGKASIAKGGCDDPCDDCATRSALCCIPPATRPRIVRCTKMKSDFNLIQL